MLNNSYNFALLLGATRTGREDIHCINAFNILWKSNTLHCEN